MITYTETDLDIMARTLFGEAKARDREDAIAIAWVIRNRVEYAKKRWGLTPKAVCLAPMQFSCWNKNDPNRERITNVSPANSWFIRCQEMARDVLIGRIPDPTYRSTHYHTPAVAPKWSKGKAPVYETTGHKFFNDIDTPRPRIVEAVKAHPVATTATVAAAGAGAVMEQTQDVPITEMIAPVTQVVSAVSYLPAIVGVAVVIVAGIGVGVWYFVKSRRA